MPKMSAMPNATRQGKNEANVRVRRLRPSTKKVAVYAAVCSRCGARANAQAFAVHLGCRGFRTVRPLPAMFADLKKDAGKWLPETALRAIFMALGKLLDLAMMSEMKKAAA